MQNIFTLVKNIIRSTRMSFKFTPLFTSLIFVAAITTSLLPLYQAKLMGDIVNALVGALKNNPASTTLLLLVVTYASIVTLSSVVGSIRGYLDKRWTLELEEGLEFVILKKRAEIDLGHYEKPEFQNLLQRALNRGIWPIYNLVDTNYRTISNLAVITVSSIITSKLNLEVYFVVVLSSIPSFIVNLKYGHETWGIWAENSPRQRKLLHIRSHIQSRTGVVQTKILQASEKLLNTARDIHSSFKGDQKKVDVKKLWYSIFANVISGAGYAYAFWIIVFSVSGGSNIGSVVFLVSALGQLVGSINGMLTDTASQFERSLYVSDIFSVLDTKPFIQRSLHPKKLSLTKAPMVEFKDVSFKYDSQDTWILRNVNLTISPGEKIALVGENGAGKSTLVKLLARIYDPTEGSILINGIDLKDISPEEWSKYMAMLLQDYMTYDFTVNESIAMGRPDEEMNSKWVQQSAQFSGAHEFIDRYENKYKQQLGKEFDGGMEPSKGQRQKLAIAQTIYRSGYVMILDEPTAAIDALSEKLIFEKMEEASGENTLIVITHRFNTTQNVDRIVVLNKGTIVEIGNHKELIKEKGLYKKMFDAQAKAFRKEVKEKVG